MPTAADLAAEFADLAIRNIRTEFPHAPAHVLRAPDDPARPRDLHPAFHGAFDWHSCVHLHWLLVRLLTDHPDRIDAAAVVSTLDSTLTPAAIRAEAGYLWENPWFARPYGWAWSYALAAACAACPDPVAEVWSAAMDPLLDTVEDLVLDWLPAAAAPVRHGVHGNTAFALAVLIDAADTLGRTKVGTRCRDHARRWFAADRDYPADWELSGQDFLSPALCEADLLRRVLPAADFPAWLTDFLPGLTYGEPVSLFTPASIVDPTDALQGHLYGLNLSRAWHHRLLAAALPDTDARVPLLRSAADRHLAAGLPAVSGHGFVLEHWLATYAYLALTAP